jgi:hypothetical protein
MDLDTTTHQQLIALSAWLKLQAQDESPPGAQPWSTIRRGLLDRAHFLDTYVLREVPETIPVRRGIVLPPLPLDASPAEGAFKPFAGRGLDLPNG